jgi:hypothetical protein
MGLFRKKSGQTGAISVFLVIVLVPCIVVACVFVDASRVLLSQSLSTSAADLALNAVMSNYDAELKKLYGLMASSQNIDDAYSRAEGYYRTLLEAKGIDKDTAQVASETMATSLKQTTSQNTDLLKARVKEPDVPFISAALPDAN